MSDFKYNRGSIGYFGLTDSIIAMINDAKLWIKACNLLFDDEGVKNALLRALDRGVALFILTNLDGTTGGASIDKKSGKKRKEAQTTQAYSHVKSLSELGEEGAHISGLDGLHAKFLLTDRGYGMVTSVNFTFNSTSKITEAGILVRGCEFDELEEVFDYLFLRPDRFKFEKKEEYYIYENTVENIDSDELPANSGLRLTLGPTERGRGNALSKAHRFDLKEEIFSIINSASKGEEIYISTYSLLPEAKGPDGETLSKALVNAKQRGVNLNILKRRMKKTEKGLLPGEVKVFLHEDNHSKIVVSGNRGIIFTGNLTPESFESGFDIGVVLKGDQIKDARNFIKEIIKETQV